VIVTSRFNNHDLENNFVPNEENEKELKKLINSYNSNSISNSNKLNDQYNENLSYSQHNFKDNLEQNDENSNFRSYGMIVKSGSSSNFTQPAKSQRIPGKIYSIKKY
jgi:hypothetical protein